MLLRLKKLHLQIVAHFDHSNFFIIFIICTFEEETDRNDDVRWRVVTVFSKKLESSHFQFSFVQRIWKGSWNSRNFWFPLIWKRHNYMYVYVGLFVDFRRRYWKKYVPIFHKYTRKSRFSPQLFICEHFFSFWKLALKIILNQR